MAGILLMGGMLCTIFSGVAGVIGTLMILVFLMAGGANSTPAQIRRIKLAMLATAVLGVGCVVGGVWLSTYGYRGWGCGVALAPALFVFGAMVWLTVAQEMNRRPPRPRA